MVTTKSRPSNAAELEEFLGDKTAASSAFATPTAAAAFMETYRLNANKADPAFKAEIKASMDTALDDFAKRNGLDSKPLKRLPTEPEVRTTNGLAGKLAKQAAAYGRGLGVQLDGQWPHLADYLSAIAPQSIQRQGIPDVLQKVMSEGAGGEGGFLVPEEFRVELLMLALEQAVVRPRARVIPMGAPTVKIPAIRDASHATSVFGGVQASWVGEAGSVSTVREPTFQQIVLSARKLTGYTRASNELAQDSAISLEAIINELFPQAIAYFEDDAFINGTGAGQPLGILNADALVSQAKETGQAANTVVYENVVKMFSRMLPQSLNRAVWVMHPNVFPQIAVMSVSVGTGGSVVWMANAASGAPNSILGRPIVFSEKCQTLGTAGDIYFVDFGHYLIGDRMALQIASSPHVQFNTDETVWRFTQRVDGRPWIATALTPRFGTTTLSPFVSLAARA